MLDVGNQTLERICKFDHLNRGNHGLTKVDQTCLLWFGITTGTPLIHQSNQTKTRLDLWLFLGSCECNTP